MRHTFRIVAILVLAALSGGAYWYFVKQGGTVAGLMALATGAGAPAQGGASAGKPAGPGGPGGAPGAMPPMPVEASPVRVGAVTRTVTAVGSLLSNESVVVRPEVAGRIVELPFQEGQRVGKGTVLVRLDDSVARATLAQAQASIAFSRAELARADQLARVMQTESACKQSVTVGYVDILVFGGTGGGQRTRGAGAP